MRLYTCQVDLDSLDGFQIIFFAKAFSSGSDNSGSTMLNPRKTVPFCQAWVNLLGSGWEVFRGLEAAMSTQDSMKVYEHDVAM